jgi:hypothetical protein
MQPKKLLIELLRWRRPYKSTTEKGFINKYIRPTGAIADPFGNYILTVPGNTGKNKILWSSHTDTVHMVEGVQNIIIESNTAYTETKNSNCLGADCSTGVAIMLCMIKAKVPGSYVFHAGEEHGCLGSKYLAKNSTEWLKEHTHAIAFDRRGDRSVITHQMGENTASEEFASSFIEATDMGMFLKPDPTGSYTDTYQYADHVDECSNISVGYLNEHTSNELQDLLYYEVLVDALCTADWSKLTVGTREPWSYYQDNYWNSFTKKEPKNPLYLPVPANTTTAAGTRVRSSQEEYFRMLIQDNWDVIQGILDTSVPDWELEVMRQIGWESKRTIYEYP